MFTKMYVIEGMSCENCAASVKAVFKNRPEVIDAQVIMTGCRAVVSMRKNLPIEAINIALEKSGHYSATEITDFPPLPVEKAKKKSSFLKLFQRKKPCCQ